MGDSKLVGFSVLVPFAINVPNGDISCGMDLPAKPKEWVNSLREEHKNAGNFWMTLESPGDSSDMVTLDIGSVGRGATNKNALKLSFHASELARLRDAINAILLGCGT